MASVGSLVVKLGLDAAEFTQGMTKAEYQARKFGEQIGGSIRNAALLSAGALTALGGAAVAASAAFNSLLEGAAKFQDLAEESGASAEGIASLAVAAGTAGVSIESVSGSMNKLTKTLVEVDDESKAAGSAIAALGLNVADFKKLDPVAQYEAVSRALAGFADGAEKTAVAMALFGKSGAEQLKVMKALQEQGGASNILTAEQIRLADEYLDKQAKLRAELSLYASAIASQFLPAMNALTSVLADAARELLNARGAVDALTSSNGIESFAESAGRALAGLIDRVQASVTELRVLTDFVTSSAQAIGQAASFDFSGVGKTAKEFQDRYGLDATGRKISQGAGQQAAKTFVQSYNETLAASKRSQFNAVDPRRVDLVGGKPPALPKLKFSGAPDKAKKGGAGDDPTKKLLDNELKAFENAAKEEEDILRSRNKMLDLYNGESLISTRDYYAGKRAAQETAVAAQSALYDQEIAALQKYQATAGKATDREAAQGKINDLLEKKKRLSREAGETALEWAFKEQRATEDLARQLNSVNAEVLELTGNLGAAARIRVGDQFADMRKRLEANGDTAGLAQVARLEKLKIAQADYGQQTEEVGRITDALRIQEERIGLARQLGADSELESLVKLRDARTATIAQMQSIVAAQEAIAKASGNPALIQNAERARLELDKLRATADPLADKFNSLFSEGLGNAFGDFITGTKTAKEAFTSFANSVVNSLARMAAESVAKQVFGGLLGGGTGGSAGSIGSLLSSLFSSGKAAGGNVNPFSLQRVNERGPELLDVNGRQYLMMGRQNGQITPNEKIGGSGGFNQSITYVVEGNVDRRTQTQLANQVRRETNTAAGRFR